MATMYRMPKMVETPRVTEIPGTMYRMPLLNKTSDLDLAASYYGNTRATTQNGPDVAALEARQEAVLARLRHLKARLDKVQGNKIATPSPSISAAPALGAPAHSSPTKKSSLHDLVISANPRQPPYSLVLLRRLLKQTGFPVLAINHMHSSVVQVNESLRQCFSDQPLDERRDHPLAFTLHWKEVAAPTLMVNPLRQTQICGEVNIVRYVSRLFPLASPFNYEAMGSFPDIAETDQLLDQLSRQLSSNSNNKERQAALRMLNGRLGKSTFLVGSSCGLADVLAWSLVKQLGLDSGAPSNVAKWYKNLSSMAGLEVESAAPESKQPSKLNQGKPNVQQAKTEAKKQDASPKSKSVSVKDEVIKSQTVVNGDTSKKPHMNRAGLESYLKGLGIKYQVTDHEEVFTVEALMKCVQNVPGLHMKNLFLKDKKKKDLYLLSARHDAEVKLNDVAKQVGVKELRFADESVMLDVIGVAQGCVTPFALVNDKEHKVTFLCDSAALDSTHPYVNFHPLSNAATLGVSPSDFKKFLEVTGHEPKLLNFT